MDRPTRAQQRAAAIDVSPTRLAAEIERLAKERDLARRQVELARLEIQRLMGGGAPASDGATSGRSSTTQGSTPLVGRIGRRDKGAEAALEALQKERDDYLAALQRERAEFLNFKRRTSEEREAMSGIASEGLIRKVLGLADDFDLAVEHRPESGVDAAWVEGIAAIDRKLRTLLESEGVTAIDAAAGLQFDPREHEAVVNVPGTGRGGGEIVEELRRGYRLRDRVIRPALVAVAEDDGAVEPEPTPTTDRSN
jgi:molecular chaperone GrpE